ncbi:hypothetical protein QKS39_gp3 [Tulasnella bunyavirales-like virus 1]|uniref:Uncharacterized protein n=1 Tax=Tulasnella bunyavirales-like virus 1 TaxID=3071304 RepID=A0A974RNE3_9VIRU|nr:hypothetical protein QKS39_gp3 [Tulasnella bunyavirales-like virus 1]QPB44678.1 hypothetical protein [Tulasnella bunyavirales-like virus 1]
MKRSAPSSKILNARRGAEHHSSMKQRRKAVKMKTKPRKNSFRAKKIHKLRKSNSAGSLIKKRTVTLRQWFWKPRHPSFYVAGRRRVHSKLSKNVDILSRKSAANSDTSNNASAPILNRAFWLSKSFKNKTQSVEWASHLLMSKERRRISDDCDRERFWYDCVFIQADSGYDSQRLLHGKMDLFDMMFDESRKKKTLTGHGFSSDNSGDGPVSNSNFASRFFTSEFDHHLWVDRMFVGDNEGDTLHWAREWTMGHLKSSFCTFRIRNETSIVRMISAILRVNMIPADTELINLIEGRDIPVYKKLFYYLMNVDMDPDFIRSDSKHRMFYHIKGRVPIQAIIVNGEATDEMLKIALDSQYFTNVIMVFKDHVKISMGPCLENRIADISIDPIDVYSMSLVDCTKDWGKEIRWFDLTTFVCKADLHGKNKVMKIDKTRFDDMIPMNAINDITVDTSDADLDKIETPLDLALLGYMNAPQLFSDMSTLGKKRSVMLGSVIQVDSSFYTELTYSDDTLLNNLTLFSLPDNGKVHHMTEFESSTKLSSRTDIHSVMKRLVSDVFGIVHFPGSRSVNSSSGIPVYLDDFKLVAYNEEKSLEVRHRSVEWLVDHNMPPWNLFNDPYYRKLLNANDSYEKLFFNMSTSGDGLLCGVRALQSSIRHQLNHDIDFDSLLELTRINQQQYLALFENDPEPDPFTGSNFTFDTLAATMDLFSVNLHVFGAQGRLTMRKDENLYDLCIRHTGMSHFEGLRPKFHVSLKRDSVSIKFDSASVFGNLLSKQQDDLDRSQAIGNFISKGIDLDNAVEEEVEELTIKERVRAVYEESTALDMPFVDYWVDLGFPFTKEVSDLLQEVRDEIFEQGMEDNDTQSEVDSNKGDADDDEPIDFMEEDEDHVKTNIEIAEELGLPEVKARPTLVSELIGMYTGFDDEVEKITSENKKARKRIKPESSNIDLPEIPSGTKDKEEKLKDLTLAEATVNSEQNENPVEVDCKKDPDVIENMFEFDIDGIEEGAQTGIREDSLFIDEGFQSQELTDLSSTLMSFLEYSEMQNNLKLDQFLSGPQFLQEQDMMIEGALVSHGVTTHSMMTPELPDLTAFLNSSTVSHQKVNLHLQESGGRLDYRMRNLVQIKSRPLI